MEACFAQKLIAVSQARGFIATANLSNLQRLGCHSGKEGAIECCIKKKTTG